MTASSLNRSSLLVLALVLAVSTFALLTAPGTAEARSCRSLPLGGNTASSVEVSSTSCRRAYSVIRDWSNPGPGEGGTTRVAAGFRCRHSVRRVSSSLVITSVRCARGSARVRFKIRFT